jgi:hypothetical protein
LIPSQALAANVQDVAGGEATVIDAIRKARSLDELESTIRRAAELKLGGVMRPLLVQLREVRNALRPEIEPLIAALIEPDDADWVEQEIDGDNPFGDRRQALARCLATAKKRWSSKK